MKIPTKKHYRQQHTVTALTCQRDANEKKKNLFNGIQCTFFVFSIAIGLGSCFLCMLLVHMKNYKRVAGATLSIGGKILLQKSIYYSDMRGRERKKKVKMNEEEKNPIAYKVFLL